MRLAKVITWPVATLGAALVAFAIGYYLAMGALAGLPALKSASVAPPPAAGGPPEEESAYRIKLMEEVAVEKGWKERDEEVKESREVRDGARIIRRPLGGVFLALVLDGSAGMAKPDGEAAFGELNAGLKEFLGQAHPGLTVAVRTMGGEPGERNCQGSKLILPVGEPGRSMAGFDPDGRRDISRALYLAAGDLANRRGRKGLAILTAGEEECGEWPCETAQALFLTREGIRTWGLRMSARPPDEQPPPAQDSGVAPVAGAKAPFVEPSPPPAGGAQPAPAPQAPEAPTVPLPSLVPETPFSALECLNKVGGGWFRTVRDRDDLAASLARVTDELSRNVVVRMFQAADHELKGESDPLMAPWKVEVAAADGSTTGALSSASLPALLRLLPGHYLVTGTYGEAQVRLTDLEVVQGEEVEIQLLFRTGQVLFLEGNRGWSAGPGGCSPEIRVVSVTDTVDQAAASALERSKCGLPNLFILPPGEYAVTVSQEGQPARSLTLTVTEGRTTAVTVDPREAPEILIRPQE